MPQVQLASTSVDVSVSFEYREISPGVFASDDTCIEVNHRHDRIYSVTRSTRYGQKRLLGGIEQITSEQWAVRWIGRDEIPVSERMGCTRIEAIAFLAATKGVR